MRLYELSWRIQDGEHQWTRTEVRAFRNAKEAHRYGLIEEYENNTGARPKRCPSERQRENAQESACWIFLWSFRFNGASEFQYAHSDEGLFEVNLGKKLAA